MTTPGEQPPEQQPLPPQVQSTEQALDSAEAALAALLVALILAETTRALTPDVPNGGKLAYRVAEAVKLFTTETAAASSRFANGGLQMTLVPAVLFAMRAVKETPGFNLSVDSHRATADASVERAVQLADARFDPEALALATESRLEEGVESATSRSRQIEQSARITARWLAREAIFDAQSNYAAALGFTKKRWVTERDRRVRHAHQLLDGVVIPISGTFHTQHGSLKYPGDITAPLNLIINCRCSLEFVR